MQNNQAGEVALSWADSFIKDLLTEYEKYQDVLKDLSTDAIAGTLGQLDTASEEYRAGAAILYNRATSSTSLVLVEVDEDVNEDAADASGETDKANKEADAEADEEGFDTERATSMVLIEIDNSVSNNLDEMREFNESWLGNVRRWLKAENDKLFERFNLDTDVITEGNITILSLAFSFFFDRFINTFFEEE